MIRVQFSYINSAIIRNGVPQMMISVVMYAISGKWVLIKRFTLFPFPFVVDVCITLFLWNREILTVLPNFFSKTSKFLWFLITWLKENDDDISPISVAGVASNASGIPVVNRVIFFVS